jgi:hypothetical protein
MDTALNTHVRTHDRRGAAATVKCSMKLHGAFHEFLKALEYADELQTTSWDFAVELLTLRRLRVTNNDLRWLVSKGFIEHAIETTLIDDSKRRFKPSWGLKFRKQSCFVLTAEGAAFGRSIWRCEHNGTDANEPAGGELLSMSPSIRERKSLTPTWDRERQELRVGSAVVKRFRVPAISQETVLAAFEEESWPPRIDDPLPQRQDQAPKRRLQETIKSLNRNQKIPLIRFLGDGSAQGVLWKYCEEIGKPAD